MDLKIDIKSYLETPDLKIDAIKFQKMLLLYNAIEGGWTIKKRKDSYVFTKNHEGKKEVFHEDYLLKFMKTNLDFQSTLSTIESTFEKGGAK
jgi:hypothetical protein